ncbi:MAG TPA: hypothetical protein VFU82_05235 [Gammaproteobacteria bacterium]|nr:hypothetical protein [Gammaproteobacteria bacterium]
MQDIKETQKALNDIRNAINGVGEQTTQALVNIEKTIASLVKAATARNQHYQQAYLKHGLQELMLSGQINPMVAKPLLPALKKAIKTLDGKLGSTYEAQAAQTKSTKAKPEANISTTPRMKK